MRDLETGPLRPLDNPILAAQRLIALRQTSRLYVGEAHDFADMLYQQAWNAIEEADPRVPKPKPFPVANQWEIPDWEARLQAASRLKIRWGEAANRYVIE